MRRCFRSFSNFMVESINNMTNIAAQTEQAGTGEERAKASGEHIDTTLVLKALAMALLHRHPPVHLLFHSDRGVQYASGDYRHALVAAGLVASMSRKGNCYDNATMESFWSTLKLEPVYRRNFDTRAQARNEIFDYIETFYNRQRTHSALNYYSPVDFELRNN